MIVNPPAVLLHVPGNPCPLCCLESALLGGSMPSVMHRRCIAWPLIPCKIVTSSSAVFFGIFRVCGYGCMQLPGHAHTCISCTHSGYTVLQIPRWDTSRLRAKGTLLKTFGGRASGPEPLESLFLFAVQVSVGKPQIPCPIMSSGLLCCAANSIDG